MSMIIKFWRHHTAWSLYDPRSEESSELCRAVKVPHPSFLVLTTLYSRHKTLPSFRSLTSSTLGNYFCHPTSIAIGLLFYVGSFVAMIRGRLRNWLTRENSNFRLRWSSIYWDARRNLYAELCKVLPMQAIMTASLVKASSAIALLYTWRLTTPRSWLQIDRILRNFSLSWN